MPLAQPLKDERRPEASQAAPPLNRASDSALDRDYLQMQADVSYLEGEAAYYDGELSKALSYFRQAALFDPHSLYLRLRRAEIFHKSGILSEATKGYEEILRASPESLEIRHKLAKIYFDSGLFDEALAHYEIMLSGTPENILLRLQQALIFTEKGEREKALLSLKKAKRLDFSKTPYAEQAMTEVLMISAYVYDQAGLRDQAEEAFRRLSAAKLTKRRTVLRAAGFFADFGRFPAAASLLREHQKNDEDSAAVARALLSVYLQTGDGEGAYTQLKLLRQAGALEPSHYFYMLSFFLEKREYSQAVLFLKDLLAASPSDSYYRYILGAVYEETGRLELALQEYGRISEGSSYFAMARKQIAGIGEKRGKREKSPRLSRGRAGLAQISEKPYFSKGAKGPDREADVQKPRHKRLGGSLGGPIDSASRASGRAPSA